MSGLVVVRRGVGHIAGGVLLGVDGAAQTVGPIVGERALLEHGLAVPCHEDRAAVLHGIVMVERAAVDDHDAVVLGAAVAEVDRAAAGRVILRVLVLLPVVTERAAVDGQPATRPDRAAAGRILVLVHGVVGIIAGHEMLSVAHVVRERAVVDGQRAVAPDRAAAMESRIPDAVRLGGVPVERAAIDGDGALGMDDRAAGTLRCTSGHRHGIGKGGSIIILKRTAIDREITLGIDVRDIAIACGVLTAPTISAKRSTVDGRPSVLVHALRVGADEQESPVGLPAEGEPVRVLCPGADGDAGIPVHVEQREVVIRDGRCRIRQPARARARRRIGD